MIGRTTVESIQSGAVFGFAGQVDGICVASPTSWATPTVVATGGLAELIAPYTESIKHVEPWLTLHGLRVVFDGTRASPMTPILDGAWAARRERLGRATGRSGQAVDGDRPCSVPYRFDPDATAAGLKQAYGHLEAGHRDRRRRSPSPVGSCCAGSRASWRSAQLADSTGRIQLFAPADVDAPTSRSSASSRSATGSASPARS